MGHASKLLLMNSTSLVVSESSYSRLGYSHLGSKRVLAGESLGRCPVTPASFHQLLHAESASCNDSSFTISAQINDHAQECLWLEPSTMSLETP